MTGTSHEARLSDVRTFLREFARTPGKIGSITPSSRQLATLTVRSAEVPSGGAIVELGAGTGPMTRAIRELHPDSPLLVLEPNPELAAVLRDKFPDAEVVEGLAQDLSALVEAWGHGPVDRVISSLPWAAWPDEVQSACFDAILEVLAPDGRMVTFTYVHSQLLPAARHLKANLESRFASVTRSRTEVRNVPPAFVWICDR